MVKPDASNQSQAFLKAKLNPSLFQGFYLLIRGI